MRSEIEPSQTNLTDADAHPLVAEAGAHAGRSIASRWGARMWQYTRKRELAGVARVLVGLQVVGAAAGVGGRR